MATLAHLLVMSAFVTAAAAAVFGGVSLDENGVAKFNHFDYLAQLESNGGYVAWGWFNDTIVANGWGTLEVHSNISYSNELQAYAAGYLEGSLTAQRIWEYVYNAEDAQTGFSPKLKAFVDSNTQYVTEMIASLGDTDPIWHQVRLLYKQNRGMYDGFANKTVPSQQLSYEVFYAATLAGEKV